MWDGPNTSVEDAFFFPFPFFFNCSFPFLFFSLLKACATTTRTSATIGALGHGISSCNRHSRRATKRRPPKPPQPSTPRGNTPATARYGLKLHRLQASPTAVPASATNTQPCACHANTARSLLFPIPLPFAFPFRFPFPFPILALHFPSLSFSRKLANGYSECSLCQRVETSY